MRFKLSAVSLYVNKGGVVTTRKESTIVNRKTAWLVFEVNGLYIIMIVVKLVGGKGGNARETQEERGSTNTNSRAPAA